MNVLISNFDKKFKFTKSDFNFLSKLVASSTGINLTEDKRELVYGRVSKRLRQLDISSFSDYCRLLRQNNTEEVNHLINVITTNVTSFFREQHHFEYLKHRIIPEIIMKNSNTGRPRLRIWSAGCSTGEEPYSIAMVLRENIENIDSWDVKILATDLDSNALDTARRGKYPLECLNTVSMERKKRWMLAGTGTNTGNAKIRSNVRSMVHFKSHNLTQSWPALGTFECIFFRNVAIYFKKETQIKLLNKFSDHLDENGTLFVGHAESLIGLSSSFEIKGHTIYRKASG